MFHLRTLQDASASYYLRVFIWMIFEYVIGLFVTPTLNNRFCNYMSICALIFIVTNFLLVVNHTS